MCCVLDMETPTVINIAKNKGEAMKNEVQNDYVIKCLGAFGRWQAFSCFVVTIASFIAMWNVFSIMFLTPTTEFICTKFEKNVTRNVSESTCYSDCTQYEYKTRIFNRTVVSDFHLICNKAWLASFTQTTLMCGILIGNFLFASISDRFGRKYALRLSAFSCVIMMFGVSFCSTYWMFNTFRFLIGVSSSGLIFVTPMYIVEITGLIHAELVVSLMLLENGVTIPLLSAFAYISSDWSNYMFNLTLASILIFFLSLFLPESPRWLVANGRVDEAVELLISAAKWNNKKIDDIKNIITKHVSDEKITEKQKNNENGLSLFRTKEIAFKTIGIVTVRAVNDIIYYGVSQYIPNVGTDIYWDVAIVGLVQIPPVFISIFVNKYLRRKIVIFVTNFAAGVAMTFLIFLPQGNWASILLGVIGIIAMIVSFVTICISSSELFPTTLRSYACGLINCGIGAMIAPFIANMSPQWIPSSIFAITALAGILALLVLPETKGKELEDVQK